jgi:bifunctional non-homologous end joining protein LigD
MLMRSPLARERRSPPGFIRPCLLTPATMVPTGPEWLHELKHDGMRVIVRKAGERVSIWSRNGRPWTTELAAIGAAVRELDHENIVLDGEAVAHCNEGYEGLPDFHRLLGDGKPSACLYAFDLLFLEGEDLRPLPLQERKEKLASALKGAPEGLRLSEHMDGPDGGAMYAHACRMGLEGVVSKRRDRAYRSGRCAHWLKILNPSYHRKA